MSQRRLRPQASIGSAAIYSPAQKSGTMSGHPRYCSHISRWQGSSIQLVVALISHVYIYVTSRFWYVCKSCGASKSHLDEDDVAAGHARSGIIVPVFLEQAHARIYLLHMSLLPVELRCELVQGFLAIQYRQFSMKHCSDRHIPKG